MVPQSSVNILLVDDYPANLIALEAILAPLQHRLVLARSGEEALKRALENDFAVILLDVQMPGMDGFETASFLKQHERTRHTPIIFLTAISREVAHIFRGYETGAVDYMVKPIEPVILQSKVRVFVELYVHGERLKQQAKLLVEREREIATEARLRVAAESAVRAREEAIATVAHDLRNPLGAVSMGAMSLLRSLPETAELERPRRQIELIARAGKRMERLVADLLDIARIEAGTFAVDLRPESPRSLLTEASETLDFVAREKEIHLEVDADEACPDVMCDRERILQVLSNLAGNALKFAPEKSVVRLRARSTAEAVELSVIDQGPGIDREQLDRIFDRYWQGAPQSRHGVGIGLAIVKGILDCHGQSIRVESEVGGERSGTTFTFALRVAPRRSGASAAAEKV